MSTVFNIVISALFIIEGLYALITGMSIGSTAERIKDKYDLDSYKKFNRIFGGAILFMGLVLLTYDLDKYLPFQLPLWVLIAAFAVVVVICVLDCIFVLKKKGAASKSADEQYVDKD